VGSNPAGDANSAALETAVASGSQSPTQYPEMLIPADLIHAIPLPAGAEVTGADVDNPFWGQISADGDWLATQFSFQGVAPGRDEQLYAVNIMTGVSRRLADHSAQVRVANARAAWVDPKCVCTYTAMTGEKDVCTAWTLHLMDLTTGTDRVVTHGSITEQVSDAMLAFGEPQDVMPTAALSSDTLAYTTGDLGTGFTLHLLSISTGAERTVELGGMIEEMYWAGDDLVWIEDTDLHHDNGGPPVGASGPYYYTGTRLMLLGAGAEVAIQIGSSPVSLIADTTGIVWSAMSGTIAFLRASGPDWTSVDLGPLLTYKTVDSLPAPLMSISDGWTGWTAAQLCSPITGPFTNATGQPLCHDPYLVAESDSAPQEVRYGGYLSGGWLFIVPRDPATDEPTGFEAVRIGDLP
jgi:hypothetical protein